jgi:hypothetical protein
MNEMSGMDCQGARAEEISKISVFRFKASEEGEQGTTIKPSKASQGFLSKLIHGYRHQGINDIESGSFEEIMISPAEDALCCICLSDYEDKELLCRLW